MENKIVKSIKSLKSGKDIVAAYKEINITAKVLNDKLDVSKSRLF